MKSVMAGAVASVSAAVRRDAGGRRADRWRVLDFRAFWRYHGIWAPGVRLLRQVGFPFKSLLLALTLLVPLTVLAWSYFANQGEQIAFSSKERLGTRYLQALVAELDAAQAAQRAEVTAEAVSELAGKANAVLARPQAELAQVEQQLGAALGSSQAWRAAQQARQAVAAAGSGEAWEQLAAHAAYQRALGDLAQQVADGSNLTLDPDLDTYYLMSAVSQLQIGLIAQLSELRELVALAPGHPSRDGPAFKRLAYLVKTQQAQAAALRVVLGKASAARSGLQQTLQPDAAFTSTERFLGLVAAQLMEGTVYSADIAMLVAAGEAAVRSQVALLQRGLPALDQLLSQRVEQLRGSRDAVAAMLVLSLWASFYMGYCFYRVTRGGLEEVRSHLLAMRDGNLTTAPRPWGRDEAASLMLTLSEVQAAWRDIVGHVRQASDHLVGSSASIASGSDDLASRTEQTAAGLERAAASMEQLNRTVQDSVAAARQASELAERNASTAREGGQVIARVVDTMQSIQAASSQVTDIVTVIDGLAFQTSLLALNAAVEAAGRTMGDIVGHAGRIRDMLAAMATQATEQSQSLALIGQVVQQMDDIARQNAALVEETAAAAAGLRGEAVQLAQDTARFRLA